MLFTEVRLLASCPALGYLSSGPYLSTCLAKVILPGAYAPSSLVLWAISRHILPHHVKGTDCDGSEVSEESMTVEDGWYIVSRIIGYNYHEMLLPFVALLFCFRLLCVQE
jgi:hypothetical protein